MFRRIPWQDVCKFLAGAFFVSAAASGTGSQESEHGRRWTRQRSSKRNVPVDVPAAELAINWDLQAFFALTLRVQSRKRKSDQALNYGDCYGF